MSTQEEFWSRYYGDVVRAGTAWLDYSNDRVQAQTFAIALEGAGPVRDKACVDFGCGWGSFSLALAALGASEVTGVDIVAEMIARNERAHPEIQWRCASLHDEELSRHLGSYDITFLIEVLQYAPVPRVLRMIWDHIRPGGRIVAIVPNAACPIVSRTRERFGEPYAAPTLDEIIAVVSTLPELQSATYRAISFSEDQTVAPYQLSAWSTSGAWPVEPNRLQFVAIKQA